MCIIHGDPVFVVINRMVGHAVVRSGCLTPVDWGHSIEHFLPLWLGVVIFDAAL